MQSCASEEEKEIITFRFADDIAVFAESESNSWDDPFILGDCI